MRPCLCDQLDSCRLCWLHRHDPRYRRLWSPTVADRLRDFARAWWQHARDWFRSVPRAEYRRRVAACRGCPAFDGGANRCTKCGCRVEGRVLAKARWKSETCPLGKW